VQLLKRPFRLKEQAGRWLVLLFFFSIASVPLLADEDSSPPALKEYLGRRIAHTMHWMGADWLTRTEREREESTAEMLKALKLKPGMVVCDLGCGNGYHSLPMARSVAPEGKVLCVDIQPEMLKLLQARADEAGVTNVELIEGSLTDPKLPEGAVDLVLIVDAYHEFSHPVHMLQAIHKSLKPDGRVVLLEFRAEDKSVPIKEDHKMSREQVTRELEANQFQLDESYDDLPWQHMLFFRKDKAEK
jgi:ubiquinone/menaquinone biosynthesis C-methylase UbiE